MIPFVPSCSYRSRDEVQSVRKTRDPISNLREKLLDSGLADTDDIKVPDSSSFTILSITVFFLSGSIDGRRSNIVVMTYM